MNDPAVGAGVARAGRRVWLLFAALAILLALLATAPRMAEAGVVDLPTLPDPGCIDSVAGAVALDTGAPVPAGGIDLDVPGPIVMVIVEWIGRDDANTGTSDLDITVTGPGGTEADPALPGTLSSSDLESENNVEDIYGWWADITDLFGDGAAGSYNVDIEPFATPGVGQAWGATVTVVYDTSPCQEVNEVIWKIGADFIYGGGANTPPTTDLIVFDWVTPLPEDTTVTIRASHGGADDTTAECRVSNIWVAVGTGTAPADTDDLVDVNGDPVHPDAVEDAVVDPFAPGNQPCPPVTFVNPPITAVNGGNVGPQWALVEMEMLLPAGSEWFAFQLESPRDNNGEEGEPESGAWAGGSLLIIPVGTQQVPDILLEKTVLVGPGGDCPGVEGTDELVVGSPGDPVTYCFRVINTGDTHLFPVVIDDPDLGITTDDMTLVSGDDTVPLAPGDELVYSFEGNINGDLLNTATVTGTPTDEEGTPLDLPDVTDDNDAEVQEVVTTTTTTPPTTTTLPPTTTTTLPTTTTTLPTTTTTAPPELEVALTAFCDNDTPWLGYDIEADGLGDEAVITWANEGGSASVTVAVGSGQVLWPGAAIDAAGNPIDWPGWDQDANGVWFLNPENPFLWAQGEVEVTVEVNPTSDPVTLTYPPANPLCDPSPDNPEDPVLPATGSTAPGGQALFGALLLLAGVAVVAAESRTRNR